MALQDVIPVLQGFSGSYAKIASDESENVTHRIELSAVRQGSADIVLQVLTDNAELIGAVAGLTAIGSTIALPIVKKIFGVIRIKKHVGDDPSNERISAENSIVVVNSNNVEIVVDRLTYELYKNRKLDKDLALLAKPLVKGRIEAAEFEVRGNNAETLYERITVEDRPYFEITDIAVTTTRETSLVARLNSLTKSTNSGYLHLQNEKRIFYRYSDDDPLNLHAIFGNYDGPVKIQCIAEMDDKLEVLSLEVLHIERLQKELFRS